MEEQFRYRVFVADDEPMAVRAICRVIEKHCPAFEVAGEAANGQEALEQIGRCRPDVVLTDIQMPVMNGLAMAREAKERYPDLCFVVISGYQDYEYMREAIQGGVLDYLAKPIMPSSITAMMTHVKERLDLLFYQRRNELLREISQGRQPEESLLARFFPYRRFCAGLIRENGLPRRFSRTTEPEIFGTLQEPFSVYGRDSMEQLFLIPEVLLGDQSMETYIKKAGQRQRQEQSYVTTLYYGRSFPAGQIAERIQGLYHWLNVLSTVGVSRCIDLDHESGGLTDQTIPDETRIEELLEELRHYTQTRQNTKLRERISQAYDVWEKEERPQLWMENVTRRLSHFIRQTVPEGNSLLENEYNIEDAFYYATDMRMLRKSLDSVFYFQDGEEKEKPRVDSPEYFHTIEEYLDRHLAEQLSLESISGRFAISQPYMGKLFRKYAGQ
ncbi:MAG: response regulator, partial [Blautia sp.]|nr:response regulator [Blautia sp.]